MEALRSIVAGTALLFVACAVSAQTGATAASDASASAPRMGGRGGMGGHHAMGGRWGSEVTSGWSMMTPAERREHRARMQSMTNYADCKSYMDEHHQEMVKRAADKGRPAPALPHRDACAGLKR
jgi:hypothetical protein